MKRTGVFITEEERAQLQTEQSVSGMFLSGGRPMGDPGAMVDRLNRKYRPGLPGLPIDPGNGEFCEP